MDKENFCLYFKQHTALNVQAKIVYEQLRPVFGDQNPALKTVER